MILSSARAIKHLLRSPRPPPPPTESQPSQVRPKKTYGLPSTHSTALTFYATYLVPLLPSLSSHLPLPIWSAQLGVIGYWVGGVWSRVELGYHTPLQVLGGVMLGAVLAVVWRGLWVGWPGFEGLLQGVIDWVWVRTFDRILA